MQCFILKHENIYLEEQNHLQVTKTKVNRDPQWDQRDLGNQGGPLLGLGDPLAFWIMRGLGLARGSLEGETLEAAAIYRAVGERFRGLTLGLAV